MNDKLVTTIKDIAESAFARSVYLKTLREKADSRLYITHNNGYFKASMELIAFLNAWSDDKIYLEDLYQNPILVNRIELLEKAKQCYQTVLNTWHIEYEDSKKIRKAVNV